jgi:hypothetical protein
MWTRCSMRSRMYVFGIRNFAKFQLKSDFRYLSTNSLVSVLPAKVAISSLTFRTLIHGIKLATFKARNQARHRSLEVNTRKPSDGALITVGATSES